MMKFAVIEAPSMLGVGPRGVQESPTALKAAGMMSRIGATFAGRIDIPPYNAQRDPLTAMLNPNGVRLVAERLAQQIAVVIAAEQFPLVFGGDCSIEVGTALALRRGGRYGMFFLDGHADFYQPEAESNGEVSSMELALITGRGPDLLTNIDNLKPYLREEDVVLFAHRDDELAADEGSQDVHESNIHIIDDAGVQRLGAVEAAKSGLATLLANDIRGFWIHLDADVLRDSDMPAVDYRLPEGGLSFADLSEVLRVLFISKRAVGMSITIFNPRLDNDGTIAQRFVASLVIGMQENFLANAES